MPPEAEPGNWHIDNIAPDGFPTPRPTGRGVTIGHPDTGYTEHSQLNFDVNGQSPNYRSDLQFNLLPDEDGNLPSGHVGQARFDLTNPTVALRRKWPEFALNLPGEGAVVITFGHPGYYRATVLADKRYAFLLAA